MILVVAAMNEEVKAIKDYHIENVELLLTGIGKVNAAAKLSGFLATHSVEAIYNIGFAGASNAYEVGDLIMIEQATYHDFDLTFFGYEKGQVPGLPAYFKSDINLMHQFKKLFQEVKTGNLFTGDYFMTEKKDHPFVVDMEGTALYQVAYQHQVPIISLKVVSDVLGMDHHHESYKKFESDEGSKRLKEVYLKLFGGKII